jgi:hypothetical protein
MNWSSSAAEVSWVQLYDGSEVKRVTAPKAPDRFKRRIREITGRAKSVGMETTMEKLGISLGCVL